MSATESRATGTPIFGKPLRTLFQPIVHLDSGRAVAYEALTRAAEDSPLELPTDLFKLAHQLGIAPDLDWECAATAVETAFAGNFPCDLPLFLNAEAASLAVRCPDHLIPIINRAMRQLNVVVEVTERALLDDPAGLLMAVDVLRRRGVAVALDDVGAVPASLALMPFLAPEVIKLDLALVQQRPTRHAAAILAAVAAQAERSGALVLAEGIETQEHLDRARVAGATLGQGWMYGYPESLPVTFDVDPLHIPERQGTDGALHESPFAFVSEFVPARRAAKRILQEISVHLEAQAVNAFEPPVLRACVEDARHFSEATAQRYQELARRCSFTAILGAGMPRNPAPGVRGGDLSADDPLTREWSVIVVGPHYAGALLARDARTEGNEEDRQFDYVVTHDRDLVLRAARLLMNRIPPKL
jgi:EAL domain-containing protein (putative c-di-GMP-specific phosphodiesterase class I)